MRRRRLTARPIRVVERFTALFIATGPVGFIQDDSVEMLLSDYTTQVQFLVHDQTNADFTQAELTAAINDAREAVALDFHCVRKLYIAPPFNAPLSPIYSPVSVITNTEAYPLKSANGLNSQIVGANVTNGGGGYSPATIVTFDVPPGMDFGSSFGSSFGPTPAVGVQAMGVPVLSQSGKVTAVPGRPPLRSPSTAS